MEDVKEESDISQCRTCPKLEVRRFIGYYPDGKNKKFVDAENSLWSGRSCPTCVRNRVKSQIKAARAAKKADNAKG